MMLTEEIQLAREQLGGGCITGTQLQGLGALSGGEVDAQAMVVVCRWDGVAQAGLDTQCT